MHRTQLLSSHATFPILRRQFGHLFSDQPIPILSEKDILPALQKAMPSSCSSILAMFSSIMGANGGIVTNPSQMVIPLDDHLVHRGHAVFDTANIYKGNVYGLDFHLNRLMDSACTANIEVRWSKKELRSIILTTAAAAGYHDELFVRYWLSSGRGDFGISPSNCTGSQFYCAIQESVRSHFLDSATARTSNIPLKTALLANMKSTNYLVNALVAMESERNGADIGIQLDENDFICESSISVVAFVNSDGIFIAPKFDKILPSTTLKRTFELLPTLVDRGLLNGYEQRDISREEGLSAQEMIDMGGGYCRSVLTWDGVSIGNGKSGPVAKALFDLLIADFENEKYTDAIPY